jgi:predicted phosphoribosyltransferase
MVVYEAKPFFRDRVDAGKRLAERLGQDKRSDINVLAVPRGGVPVAIEVADKLGVHLDIVVPRKITIPHNPEAGYGAVAEDGTIVLNEPLVGQLGLSEDRIKHQAEGVRKEVARRSKIYRGGQPPPSIEGKTAIIIDDGLASGFTMIAAIESVKKRRAGRVVVAVPVASGTAYDLVNPRANDLVSLVVARTYGFAVASFYHHWYDLSDEEAIKYLEDWRARHELARGNRGLA